MSRRKFPGFNFEGGTAKITKVHDERSADLGPMKDGSARRTTGFTYGVKYVMGGSEKRVDAQHIASKREVSREAASAARQEEVAAQRAERERAEAAARAEEAARVERKRAARAKVAALREAKKRVAKPAAAPAKKRAKTDAAPPAPAPPAEEPADAAWLRGVLATAPRDVPDELDLEAFHAHAAASSPPAALGGDAAAARAGVRALLARLEADNHVMVVDGTLFLV